MNDKIILEKFAERFTFLIKENNTDISELIRKLGLKSKVTIYRYMHGKMAPKVPTIKFLSELFSVNPIWLMGYDVPMDVTLDSKVNLAPIPILGMVKAGYDYLAAENIVGYIRDFSVPDPENYYALYVHENSMEPILSDGDIVIVHKQNDFENGNTCIVLIGEEVTIKKVFKKKGGIELVPANPYCLSRSFTKEEINSLPVKILGRVVEGRTRNAFK